MTEERRVVTVLFADVVGSTSIGETLDPEDLRHLLAGYFAIARGVIEEYGGTLEKFIGDAVMAIFGVPRAHDDDVARALSAALDLRQRVRADPRLAARLPIRIGVNTGEVASGTDPSTGEVFVTGDTVNVAARIQQEAKPWSIVVGQRTVAAAGGAFSFGPLIEMETRGRAATVDARELLSARPAAGSTTPFVGRAADLAQLELVAQRAFNEHHPWSVTIVAPPGTGKSRLLAEFLVRLPSGSARPLVAQAQCLPYGQRLSYSALRPMLYELIGVSPETTPDALLDTATIWLSDAGVPDAPRIAELLATTVGIGAATAGTAPPSEGELFSAWRTLFEAAAKSTPLVLAFEDLHWSSDSLLDLLDFALQPRRDISALLICVARPELLERRPDWGAGRRNQTTIDLSPLDPASIGAIVEHLLPASAHGSVESIVERAGGNPFFATEMARTVVERTEGQPTTALGRPMPLLPDTIQATIQARLDLLGLPDRRVLQAGAVFGRSFSSGGVAAVLEAPVHDVAQSIDRLIDRDLLTPAEGGGENSASHILIRDVAYGAMPRLERAHAHAAAARWLAESAGSAQPVELIAFHYREAASLLASIDDPPADLPPVRLQAVEWLGRSADRALATASSADAASHLQAAIELADRTALPMLYERLGDTNLQGELTADAYRQAFELADELALPADLRLRIGGKLLMQYTRAQGAVANRPSDGEIEQLRSSGRALISASADQQSVARFLIAEAFLPFWAAGSAEPAAARVAAREGLAIAESLDDFNLRSAALDALTALSDTWPEAFEYAQRRLQSDERLEMAERLDAHAVVAWSACILGELTEADRASAAGLALVQPGQVPTYALHLAVWRIYALRLLGRWDDVEAVAEQALELWFATGREAAGFALRGFIDALLVCRARRREEAADRFQRAAQEILEKFPLDHPIRRFSAFLEPNGPAAAGYLSEIDVILPDLNVLGRADYAERAIGICVDHRWPLAVDDLEKLRDRAQARGCRLLEAQLHRAIGLALDESAELHAALAGFESAGARPLVARAQIELGGMTGRSALVETGVAKLRALGDLEHLDLVVDRSTGSAAR